VVQAAAAAALLVRLPLLGAPVTPDEAGFLVIARGWSEPGVALYGDYWVDRPPLLLMLFQAAHLTGGLVALRLLGALAGVGAGAVATTCAVLAWAWPRGAGPVEVLEATYLFRLEAVSVIADGEEGSATRAGTLVVAWAGSGLAVACSCCWRSTCAGTWSGRLHRSERAQRAG
jgi:hypothetical protein